MKALKKWFTLVELIVVITILAILGTIAFISLQGYSADARNTKRSSDLASIQSAMSTAITQGASVMSYAVNDNTADSRVSDINIGGTSATAGTDYEAGHINYSALALKAADFTDPSANVPYNIGVTSRAGGKYEIAATIEKGATKLAKVVGDYSARGTSTVTGAAASGSTIFVITSTADINKFKIGDTISTTPSRTISAISPNGLTLTISGTVFGSGVTTVALANAESAGLIDKYDAVATSGSNEVTEGSTVNYPYTY